MILIGRTSEEKEFPGSSDREEIAEGEAHSARNSK